MGDFEKALGDRETQALPGELSDKAQERIRPPAVAAPVRVMPATGAGVAAAVPSSVVRDVAETTMPTGRDGGLESDIFTAVLHYLEIEVEAVVGGVRQRLKLTNCPPELVGEFLKSRDKDAKWHDDLPRGKSWGSRDTKSACVMTIVIDVRDSGKFIKLISMTADEDFSVHVPKKLTEEFLNSIPGFGRLSDKNLTKLTKGLDKPGEVTVRLDDGEHFGVTYWTADDGKHIADSLVSEPPALESSEKEASKVGD